MRTFFLVTFFLFTGFISFAHCIGPDKQMETIGKGSLLTLTVLPVRPDLKLAKNHTGLLSPCPSNAVSIYVFRDTKVRRALEFKAEKDKPLWG